MREYHYYMDGSHTLVRDGSFGVEELWRNEGVWKEGGDWYWQEIYFGQGFDCLWPISLEEAREYLANWGFDPDLAPAFSQKKAEE